jgi:predicted GH43/DUF377 family glycosyl hydrolase
LVAKRTSEKLARDVKTVALITHSWANPKPDYYLIESDELIIFSWDKFILIDGEWKLHPEIEQALKYQISWRLMIPIPAVNIIMLIYFLSLIAIPTVFEPGNSNIPEQGNPVFKSKTIIEEESKFIWERYPGNPVFPAVPGTWMEDQTANPDLLLIDDIYYMYFRGQRRRHDRIGVATIPKEKFDGVTWNIHPEPIIDVGGPGSWDEVHALDPATVLVDGKIYLYYTGVSPLADRAICLAVSEDGINFMKYDNNPVIIGGAPEVVYRDGIFFLYYWREVPDKGGFQIHYATSTDGYHFTEPSQSLSLPVGEEGEWDSFTVETPRILREGGLYYMIYCGSNRHKDYPYHAGLATSKDLVHWEKYPGNPIFSRGEEGDWDEGAIWFTTVEKINGIYYMWYEGYGGGTARTEAYGSYLQGGKSQVGMAVMRAPYFYILPDNSEEN